VPFGGRRSRAEQQMANRKTAGSWLLPVGTLAVEKWKRQRQRQKQKQSVETVGSQQKTANRQTTDKCTLLPNEASQKHGPRHNVCPCFCAEKCIHAALRRPSHTARKWGQY